MRLGLMMLGILLLCGCSGDSGSELSPTEKCQTVQNTLCDRAMECINATHPECVQEVNFTSLNCDTISGATDSYDACLTQIMTGDCMTLFPGTPGRPPLSPPEMCNGTFMHSR